MKPIPLAQVLLIASLGSALFHATPLSTAQEIGKGRVFEPIELAFTGPQQSPRDTPAGDIDLRARFQHEDPKQTHTLHGFWDGDGQGGLAGNVFKIRFTPTQPGRWTLAEVHSNQEQLNGQREGQFITVAPSNHPGFWRVDLDSPGGRWYRRSDGSHPYFFGNTHYSFLSGCEAGGKPSHNDIAADIAGNAQYFKKLRFTPLGDRYPHPKEKPFLDDDGQPTDSGSFSHRPNPRWFHQRVDLAVQTAYDHDLIADLILAGPDAEDARSTLLAQKNNGDPTPYLKYMAARYGSYPNVWICLCNEYEIKQPKYSEMQMAQFGQTIRQYLSYPTPLSVHSTPGTLWAADFDALPQWADHMIIQRKIRNLAIAADVVQQARRKPGGGTRSLPTINDELSYQGQGDKHSEGDTIESHLGIFLGGGYGTTGEKPGNKLGQYFRGKFDPSEHTAADNLGWLQKQINDRMTFWKMAPDLGIFSNLDKDFRGMSWPGREYVLGANKARKGLTATLPSGEWGVTRFDVMAKEATTLSARAEGDFTFDAPASRAVLFLFKKL